MVDGATLERLCGRKSTGGSNPPPSANEFHELAFFFLSGGESSGGGVPPAAHDKSGGVAPAARNIDWYQSCSFFAPRTSFLRYNPSICQFQFSNFPICQFNRKS